MRVAGRSRWYGWDYKRFGNKPTPAARKVLLWYTDGAQHELRWTCTELHAGQGQRRRLAVRGRVQIYGHRPWLATSAASPR